MTCAPGTLFVRGDCNADNGIDIGDPVAVVGVLFSGTGPALFDDACDMNDDGSVDISDPIFLLSNLFSGGADPPADEGSSSGPSAHRASPKSPTRTRPSSSTRKT